MTALVPFRPHETLASQADTDSQFLDLWLHGRGLATRRAYERDSGRFLAFVGRSVRQIKLADVQACADSLEGLAPATRSRAIAVAKSLLGFAHRLGYVPFNVVGAVKVPSAKDARAECILPEATVQRMLALETNARNRVLLRLLYASGVRVSELCGLRRRDLQARDDGGQVTVFGKGRKTRTVLLPASVWRDCRLAARRKRQP
jgi:integrase/recombinase XerD